MKKIIPIAIFLAGCSQTQLNQFQSQVNAQLDQTAKKISPGRAEVAHGTIGQSKVNNIYNGTSGLYPRVALQIISAPEFHQYHFDWSSIDAANTKSGCYNIEATIWRTNKKSEKDNFTFCTPGDVPYNVPMLDLISWLPRPLIFSEKYSKEGSGDLRTRGPKVPNTPAPDNLKSRTFLGISGSSTDYAMIGGVLYAMGFDWTVDDRRVWFLDFPSQ